ncbi:MAG: SUMF1/EgtB/PvdO family nonheme iron enzyme [Myxococcota bacterium]
MSSSTGSASGGAGGTGAGGGGGVAFVADCTDGWCSIPAGTFMMGSPDGEVGHSPREQLKQVTLTRAFEMGQYEVTRAQWGELGYPHRGNWFDPPDEDYGYGDCQEPSCPAGNVSWFDAITYANERSRRAGLEPCFQLDNCTGSVGEEGYGCTDVALTAPTIYECEGYRLPTTAEWEWAARAGTWGPFYPGQPTAELPHSSACVFDESLAKAGWYCANSEGQTHPVGLKMPNNFGLYDTLGNAIEWVFDHDHQQGWPGVVVDPGGTVVANNTRVVRGGVYLAWNTILRVAYSHIASANRSDTGGGFRLARTLPAGAQH